MKLTFYGGAKIVTGANHLLEEDPSVRSGPNPSARFAKATARRAGSGLNPSTGSGLKVLIDCGLFQGAKFTEDLNYEKFSYEPSEVDYILVTHSHIDHIGRLPKLIKEGFKGKVYLTKPAKDLIERALPDSFGHVKREAKRDGREPLYRIEDIDSLMELSYGVDYNEEIKLSDNISFILHDAGHILGSSIVEVKFNGKKIIFSGDLGNSPTPLLRPAEFVKGVDYVVVESAYGDRIHEDREKRKDILEDIIEETATRGGTLMIPSFAMERTQELLYELNEMVNFKRIPELPVFIDSPLALKLTEVYRKYPDYFNKDVIYIINSGDDIFKFPGLKLTKSAEESKKINDIPPPKVIIAGSGMSQGGRILHHEMRYLSDEKSTILFIGYQVKGSLGRQILEGAKEVKIFGQPVPVRCHIVAIGGYSAHADQPALINWVEKARIDGKLKRVFVVQGEEEASEALAVRVRDELAVDTVVPNLGESFEL